MAGELIIVSPIFLQFINLLFCDSQVETSLRRQESDLKEELGSINMTDEFAKYSKIQRKLIKISDELRNKSFVLFCPVLIVYLY